MSEYQYYAFQALDRPLSEEQMAELRAISTRAEITPTSFTNVYHWGDLKADPIDLLAKYFDAFLYVANWGTHWLAFRFPGDAVDLDTVKSCAGSDALAMRRASRFVLIEFHSQEEPEDWEEGIGWLASLVSLRADLLRGDGRALYLGWLYGVQMGETDLEAREPAVPPGLAELSAPLKALVEFLRLDTDLVTAAACASPSLSKQTAESKAAWQSWVASLDDADKDDLLCRVAGGDPAVPWELHRRFRQRTDDHGPASAAQPEPRRTVRQIVDAAGALTEQRRRRLAEERARRAREEAAKRKRYLQDLATREDSVRAEIEALIDSKQQAKYDRAVQLLTDLRDAAALSDAETDFNVYTTDLRRLHARKTSLIHRLDKAGL